MRRGRILRGSGGRIRRLSAFETLRVGQPLELLFLIAIPDFAPFESYLPGKKIKAPAVGFEPTTLRLTAACSTVELRRNLTEKKRCNYIRFCGIKQIIFYMWNSLKALLNR